MSSIVQYAPDFNEQDAENIAADLFGAVGGCVRLPSERDQNFRVRTDSQKEFVLKIANATEDREVLDFQNQVMQKLGHDGDRHADRSVGCPEVCTTLKGETITTVAGEAGQKHFVRLLTYLPGKPLAMVRPHDPTLLSSLGRFFGRVDRTLEGFDHNAAHRNFHWDLKQASRVVGELIKHIATSEKRRTVTGFLEQFQARTEPLVSELRRSVIHNDGNDYNILIVPEGAWGLRVGGLIDFGDMVHTHTVNELAIVCAYAMLNKKDPLTAARHIVAGYHEAMPLTENELAVLYDLICMRLCMSVCHCARQSSLEPGNEYLRISEKPAWALLHRLESIHPRMARYVFREACGLQPISGCTAIVQWLENAKSCFEPIIETDLHRMDPVVFDLSVGSTFLGAGQTADDISHLSGRIASEIFRRGSTVGIGRYGEARFFYRSPAFETATDVMSERRTIHLGIDLYMAAGSPIKAFMAGKVHSYQNNASHLDYGPTIILEHTAGDVPFYTLYGHLSMASIADLKPGKIIDKGEVFAEIGSPDVNGGWPPHLHFQVITDMFGQTGNFPGVARPSRRDVWKSICPDPNIILGIPEACLNARGRTTDDILRVRKAHIGRNLSIAYERPLKIVKGEAQYLFSHDGQVYVDGVNNVSHVGHCHPDVVTAGQRQMAVLNTNTRYLHDNIIEYTQRLLATFPDPLSVCFFVCTGSEANELAFRMARTFTGQKDIISLDGAYHGNTNLLIDISPYKHGGPGGKGAPPWVKTVVMPDGYRGPHKGTDPVTAVAYAAYVKDAVDQITAEGRGVSAFICESILGCGGQVVLPDNYMQAAFEHVRAAGGVCIADEIQVGFGRAGTHFWAFEAQGCIPDIVTLGKPIGNGHPMAAVVTTPEIAEVFANGMEYFNTFGGNPVSCAVGLAVLDVIQKEKLQENARRVGARLLSGFNRLMEKFPLIGSVRGLGLFIGVELVKDRDTIEPAPDHAGYIVNRMRDYGFLMSTDGPLHNVLKLKPPLVFSEQNADDLLSALDEVLQEDCLQVEG
ncbi:MAG: aminotransferase class III-fold pyridoxal phosphate-dependent enzyme [Deltaproteobacteria bacterium]|nr:aminotransferase class III-fold pyridoxal phosphate-dependent enzyme [Deltaproteobacteria bacterium]